MYECMYVCIMDVCIQYVSMYICIDVYLSMYLCMHACSICVIFSRLGANRDVKVTIFFPCSPENLVS